jgi:hypothetical protein
VQKINEILQAPQSTRAYRVAAYSFLSFDVAGVLLPDIADAGTGLWPVTGEIERLYEAQSEQAL